MIDLHLHLLPGVDDGAETLEVSRQMLERQKANGFTTLVTTPHLLGSLSSGYASRVERAFNAVQELALPMGMDVRLGYENMLSPDLPARLQAGEAVTLAGSKTVLVEVPMSQWPAYTEQTLFNLQAAEFQPVLAHPERYDAVQQNSRLALDVAERGVVLQVTLGSLVGLFGKNAQRAAELLVQRAAAVVVATDAHRDGRRTESVSVCLDRLRELVGEEAMRQFTEEGPRALLTDAPMPAPLDRAQTSTNGTWGDRVRRLIRPG